MQGGGRWGGRAQGVGCRRHSQGEFRLLSLQCRVQGVPRMRGVLYSVYGVGRGMEGAPGFTLWGLGFRVRACGGLLVFVFLGMVYS